MNFEIQNPTPRLAWNQDEGFAGVLSFDRKPLSAFWLNAHDQDGETTFIVSFPDCQDYREEIEKAIEVDLSIDYSYKEEHLYPKLGSFFKLLPNGEYKLYVSYSEDYISLPRSRFSSVGPYQVDYFKFLFPVTPPKSKLSHIAWYEKGWKTEKKVNKTTSRMDGSLDYYLLSTIPASFLNPKRVGFYEAALKKGKRPAVIVFRCFDAEGEGYNYVLDGHNKLLAYANLELMPHIIFITQEQAKDSFSTSSWDFNSFIYLLSPWQANSFLEHFSSFKLQDSEGNFQALDPFITSSITEEIEIFWAQDRTSRREQYYKDGLQTAFLYQGYLNDRPSTSFRYKDQNRHIFYHLLGDQLIETQEHSAANWELLVHKKWNDEKGILEDIPIQKPEPEKAYKPASSTKGVYKPYKLSWRERYKNEIYYTGMGLFMLIMFLKLLSTCS